MKLNPSFLFVLLLSSCVYDSPKKGEDLWIHNQTDKSIMILDSLTGSFLKLYDTAKVNNRIFIDRSGNHLAGCATYNNFYSEMIIHSWRRKNNNNISLFIVDENDLHKSPTVLAHTNHYRTIGINIDTLRKYRLNHLFIFKDTILFEHTFESQSN